MNNLFQTWRRPAAALALTAGLLATLTGCDPDKEDIKPAIITTSGAYVVNEGTSNGSIDFFDKTSKAVRRNLYAAGNGGRKLGPYVQDMTIVGDNAYLVVNGADSVQVVRLSDFQRTAGIGGFSQPRYLVNSSATKGYVSEWKGRFGAYTAGNVAVLNLATNTITKRIAVGVNPNQMLLLGDRLYVTAAEGNALTIINTSTDAVESTITLPDGPKNILSDGSGNIWVLCSKYLAAQDFLVRFAPATPTQQTRIALPVDYRNGNLRRNGAGDKIYVSLGGGTYELAPTATALPATPLIKRNFYALGVDPQDGTIYGGTATFSGDAKLIRYSAAGLPLDSSAVGTGPNAFIFR